MSHARTASDPASPGAILMTPSAAERREMISVAAYYRAERRGFAPGGAEQDWLEAEAEIDRLLTVMAHRGISREAYERAGLRNALRLWVV